MTNYTIKEDQTIFDVALQLYGDASKIFNIIDANLAIETILQPVNRTTIVYDETDYNDISTFFNTNAINIVTGSRVISSSSEGSFDDSFDDSFG